MAVPSGHVGRVETAHIARLYHEILQGFVERGAQVNRAVGVRRPVVQDIDGLPFVRLADAVVEPRFLPMFEHFGLVFRQVRLHGEVGLGQIQR